MQINPLAQHVELAPVFSASSSAPRPEGALVVTASAYDQPDLNQVERDLIDVRPAAFAIESVLGDSSTVPSPWGPAGLLVGTLAINMFSVNPVSGGAQYTIETTPGGSVNYYHQFSEHDTEWELSSSQIFEGGVVMWGDGSSSSFVYNQTQPLQHTYASAGTYDVRIELHFRSDLTNFAWSNSPSAVRRVTLS